MLPNNQDVSCVRDVVLSEETMPELCTSVDQRRDARRHGKCTSTVDQDVPSGSVPGGLAEVHK